MENSKKRKAEKAAAEEEKKRQKKKQDKEEAAKKKERWALEVANAIPCLEQANEKQQYLQDREVTLTVNLNDLDDISAMDDDSMDNLANAKANNNSKKEFQLDGQLCLQAEKPWAFPAQEVADHASMPPPEPIQMPHRRHKTKAVSRDEISLSEVTAVAVLQPVQWLGKNKFDKYGSEMCRK
jgi:hypothetical protein